MKAVGFLDGNRGCRATEGMDWATSFLGLFYRLQGRVYNYLGRSSSGWCAADDGVGREFLRLQVWFGPTLLVYSFIWFRISMSLLLVSSKD